MRWSRFTPSQGVNRDHLATTAPTAPFPDQGAPPSTGMMAPVVKLEASLAR